MRWRSDTLLKLVILDSSPQNALGIWYNYWNIPLLLVAGAVEMQCHIVLLTEPCV